MRTIEYRQLLKRLREFDPRFNVHTRRGKGSHRMLYHPDIDGVERHYPLPYHGGKTPIFPGYQKDIIRIFGLPEGFFDEN